MNYRLVEPIPVSGLQAMRDGIRDRQRRVIETFHDSSRLMLRWGVAPGDIAWLSVRLVELHFDRLAIERAVESAEPVW